MAAHRTNGVHFEAERHPNKTFDPANQVSCRLALCIERTTTADMDDGQSLPPFIDDGIIWCRVCRLPGSRTLWRRIFLSASSVTPGAASAGEQTRAP